ncbi:hypothetical protein [Arsenophonus nasoniae]
MSLLVLVGCKNGFSEYTPDERKAIMKEHDKQWRELRENLRKKRFYH